MLYAIAAILAALVVLVLIGKPIRVEIIHTVTPPPLMPEEIKAKEEQIQAASEALSAMAYINEVFHHVEEANADGKPRK